MFTQFQTKGYFLIKIFRVGGRGGRETNHLRRNQLENEVAS
jgi:hypothetical protein